MIKKPKKFSSFFGGVREAGKLGFKSMFDNNYVDDTLEKDNVRLEKNNLDVNKQLTIAKEMIKNLNKDKK